MIILNLRGGTGNQLFQYATGRHLAIKNNDILKLEAAGLERANTIGDIYRPLALCRFNIAAEIATPAEVKRLKYPYGLLSKVWRLFKAKILRRYYITFDPTVLDWQGDLFLDGYFQSPRYFNAIRDTLVRELTLQEPLSVTATHFTEQIQRSTAISLHVRRGDYAKNPRVAYEYGSCTKNYYLAALDLISKQVTNPTYFIFSDDIAWVKEHLPVGEGAVFVEGQGITDIEELMLMSKCQHNIIANSSFSWWGAWLNQNPQKIVIAPTPWFDHVTYDKDLIPPGWIQLPKA